MLKLYKLVKVCLLCQKFKNVFKRTIYVQSLVGI